MGWLLSCKAAYVPSSSLSLPLTKREPPPPSYHTGLPILYSTNTFFFSNAFLFLLFEPVTLSPAIAHAAFDLLTSLHLKFSVTLFGSPPCLPHGHAHQLLGTNGIPWLLDKLRKLPLLAQQLTGLRHLAVSFTDLLDQRFLATRQLRRRDLELGLWLLRPLEHTFMRLPDRVWQGAKVIVERPENVYTVVTRGRSAPLQIEDIEPGIDWTGGGGICWGEVGVQDHGAVRDGCRGR